MRVSRAQRPNVLLVIFGQRGLDSIDVLSGGLRTRVDVDFAAADEVLKGPVKSRDGRGVRDGDIFGVAGGSTEEDIAEDVEDHEGALEF